MEITIKPTERITFRNKIPFRIWQGTDDAGNRVVALVESLRLVDFDEQPERGSLRVVNGSKPNTSGLERVPYHLAFEWSEFPQVADRV